MAFADPQSFPLSSGARSLTRINQDGYSSEWRSSVNTTDQIRMRIRHSTVPAKGTEPAKDRHNVEIVRTVYATATAAAYTEKCYVVIEQAQSNASVEYGNALSSWLTATTNAALTKLMGWES